MVRLMRLDAEMFLVAVLQLFGRAQVSSNIAQGPASGPRACPSAWDHWLRRMDQQIGAIGGMQRALMPALTDAPPRRSRCPKHQVHRWLWACNPGLLDSFQSVSCLDRAVLATMTSWQHPAREG